MSQIFISYKHNNKIDLFKLLLYELERAKYTIWTDKKISPGESWTKAIDTAIQESFAVIVVMTKEAHESPYVTYEWSYALGNGKPVITLKVDDDIELHPRLTEYQFIDFTGENRPFEAIIAGLERIAGNLRETRLAQAFNWMKEGDSELEQDDVASALDSYNQAYNLADDRLRVRIGYKMARLYIRQIEKLKDKDKDKKAELVEKAEQLLKAALETRPNYHAARAYLAYVYRLKRDVVIDDQRREALELARTNFKQALENQPDLIDHNGESWWNAYGGVLRRLGDMKKTDQEAAAEMYKEAIDAYQTATEVGRKSSYSYGNLGVLYLLKGDKKNMEANYTKVQFYPPNDAGDFWSQGDQLLAQLINTNPTIADQTYNRYIAFAPDYARTSLLETLRNVAKALGAKDPRTKLFKDYIKRLETTLSTSG